MRDAVGSARGKQKLGGAPCTHMVGHSAQKAGLEAMASHCGSDFSHLLWCNLFSSSCQ